MLSFQQMGEIRLSVEQYWREELKTPEFIRIASGKEIGHKIGDLVDEKTTELLATSGIYSVLHQLKDGKPASRSMGDLWIAGGGIYNPVNIKAGVYGKNGQPNLVSLKRVIRALAGCLIDSYYLLIMKIENVEGVLVPRVFLVDMLDFLDYTVFNSGPGQLMLKEAHFYPEVIRLYAAGLYQPTPCRSLSEKIECLYLKLEQADRSLYEIREEKRMLIQEQIVAYGAIAPNGIDKKNQKEKFNLG